MTFSTKIILVAALTKVFHSCVTPCETQTFRFGEHTIEFPIDVATIKSRIPDVQMIPKSYLLAKTMEDTLIHIWYSSYTDHRFAPDGEDTKILNDKGVEVTDTLGKGIYNYCFYLPETAYDSTLRYLEQTYGTTYDKRMVQYSRVPYYVWTLTDCTKLVFACLRNHYPDQIALGNKVTYVAFSHRLTDHEIDLSIVNSGFRGKTFD
jgi:hypothetical protein